MADKICVLLQRVRGPSLHGDGGEVVVRAAVLAVAGHLVARRHPHAEVARQHGGAADEVEIAYRVLQQLPAHFTTYLADHRIVDIGDPFPRCRFAINLGAPLLVRGQILMAKQKRLRTAAAAQRR